MRLFSSRRALARVQARYMARFFLVMGVLSFLFAFVVAAALLR